MVFPAGPILWIFLMVDTTRILGFNEPGFLGAGFNKDIVGVTNGISQERLYSAYMQGIFPWFNEDDGEPVVWYSPNPRFCLPMEELHVPSSVDKFLKHTPFSYTFDKDFFRRHTRMPRHEPSRAGRHMDWRKNDSRLRGVP